jgi:hypothetical protein
MSDFVSAAPPSGGIDWNEHKGRLLVVEPLGVEIGIKTAYGENDAVRANVYVITGPDTSEDHEDTLVFPKVLQSQLKGKVGSKVTGRLAQGQAKPGQSAPWLIDAATEDDIQKAQLWLAARNGAQLTSATPTGGQAEAQPPF